ncbi:hypothetical protein J7E74_00570 [Rhodococcus erythropolis]|nr:hypothetical protein [Rhodococcus erythropolis]
MVAIPSTAQAQFPIFGSIRVEYDQVGNMGAAIGPEADDRQGGKFQDFVNNNHIYWNARIDPNRGRQIGGAIFDKWATTDWENGFLGYPTSREFSGGRSTRGNHFENGDSIYWTNQYGAHIVGGQIGQTWRANGYENGQYGAPTSDEYDFDGGKKQDFEFGSITWRPSGFPEDIEDENIMSNCGADECTLDNRRTTVGLYDFSQGSAGNRRALTPEEQDANAVEAEASEEALSEPGETLPLCSDHVVRMEGAPLGETSACWSEEPLDITYEDSPTSSTPATPSTTPTSTEVTTPTNTEVSPPSSTDAETTTPSTANPKPTTVAPSTTGESTAPSPTCRPEEPQADGTPVPSTTTCASTTTVPAAEREDESGFDPFMPRRQQQIDFKPNYNCSQEPWGPWRGDRNYACTVRGGFINFWDTQNKPVGHLVFNERRDSQLSWKTNKWTERYSIKISEVKGVGENSILTAQGGCVTLTGVCTSTGETSMSPQVIKDVAKPDLFREWTPTLNWPSGTRPTAIGTWQASVKTPDGKTYKFPAINSPSIRCDNDPNMRNYVGCAFWQAPPVLDYSFRHNLPNFNSHVTRAQASGLPGAPGQAYLTRIYDPNTIDDNRKGACGGVTGPRNGVSCDEYPFASTQQGGRPNGPNSGPGRTFDGCGIKDTGITPRPSPVTNWNSSGFSVCLIPIAENSRAGSYLSWFFTQNRVLKDDRFWVKPQ